MVIINSTDIYNSVMEMYANDRNVTFKIKARRLEEISKKIPEIEELTVFFNSTSSKILKTLMSNDSNKEKLLLDLEQQTISLINKKCELLIKNGFPETYLDDIYICHLCQDTGYVGTEKCLCFKQRLIDKYCDIYNLKEILDKENFDNFNFDLYSKKIHKELGISPYENIQLITNKVKTFIKNFDSTKENFLFYGATGLGKTFLCNCIAKALIDKHTTVVYLTAPRFFSLIEDYRFNRNKSDSLAKYFEYIKNADLFIIDDLGLEFITTLTKSEVFNVINSRILDNKSTVISTNLSLDDLSKTYNQRITSRFVGHYTICQFAGDDIRSL